MEPRDGSKIFRQPRTVARFESLPELLDSVACDLFCLFDFHFLCPPVSGSPCSLHPQSREQGRETGGQKRKDWHFPVATGRTHESRPVSGGAKRASGDRGRTVRGSRGANSYASRKSESST